jgi:hypothetical protein
MIVLNLSDSSLGVATIILLVLCKLYFPNEVLQNVVYLCWMLAKLAKIIKPIILIGYENRKRFISTKPYLRKWLLVREERNMYLWRNALDVYGNIYARN